MVTTTVDRDVSELQKTQTLGTLRLRHAETNEIVLIPTPSNDPNDPLNWSKAYKWYIAILVCVAMFFCNFLAAGPTVAIVEITSEFFAPPGPDNHHFMADIAKIAYFFTTTALLQGMGTLIWTPLVTKFGRRPVYVASYVLYTATAAWAGAAKSYGSELASRIVMGFAAGAAEALAPLTIADVFFLHERGTVMAAYTCALSTGVSGGIVIAGLITIDLNWRYIYWVSTALIGAVTILVIFTFPETMYVRDESSAKARIESVHHEDGGISEDKLSSTTRELQGSSHSTEKPIPRKMGFLSSLRVFTGVYTQEPLWKLATRPMALLFLPPVFWATLVMASTIGFLVAISSNFASAFDATYSFKPYQSGLCFISALIGAFIAIFFGGHFSDYVADVLTRRNGGIRKPEMRLPTVLIACITGPLALVLYGAGIQYKLHWICPTIGLGLLNFTLVLATNVSLVYTIDSYRPVAGELVVTQMAFKSAFGFLLSFYTNTWVAQSGYLNAFGAMAGISGGVLLCWVPLYFLGEYLREKSWNWPLIKQVVHWDEDREVGE